VEILRQVRADPVGIPIAALAHALHDFDHQRFVGMKKPVAQIPAPRDRRQQADQAEPDQLPPMDS
jgi:hypothetical protein